MIAVQHQCEHGCDQHQSGEWYTKNAYRNPIKALIAYREIKTKNWKSAYRVVFR